ncbi:MAG: hypothetical protein KDJ15_05870 [Alphaproteobacteria bacterium]|nr:hypothetical protein [Alphaproteobacteria bacterium]
MKLLRLSVFLGVAAAVLSGVALFWTSQAVRQDEVRLRALYYAALRETQSIRVLQAEWDYLNRPARLETLAWESLAMSAPTAGYVAAGVAALPDPFVPMLPTRKPAFVYVAKQASAVVPVSAPTAAETIAPERDFQDLLDHLGRTEGAP